MTNNILSLLGFSLVLAGCGGSSSNLKSPTPPQGGTTTANRAPSLTALVPLTTYSNSSKLIVLNASDPDGDILTFSAISSDLGIVVNLENTNLLLSSTDKFFGTADVTVTVSDGFLSSSSSFTVNVLQTSIPPIPSFSSSQIPTPPSIPSL